MTRVPRATVFVAVGLFIMPCLCAFSIDAEASRKPGGGSWNVGWFSSGVEYDYYWSYYYEETDSYVGLTDVGACSFDPGSCDVFVDHQADADGTGWAQVITHNGIQGPSFTCWAYKIVGYAHIKWAFDYWGILTEATDLEHGDHYVEALIKVCANMCNGQNYWMLPNSEELEICHIKNKLTVVLNYGDPFYYEVTFPVVLYYGETYTFWSELVTYTYAESEMADSMSQLNVCGELLAWSCEGTILSE